MLKDIFSSLDYRFCKLKFLIGVVWLIGFIWICVLFFNYYFLKNLIIRFKRFVGVLFFVKSEGPVNYQFNLIFNIVYGISFIILFVKF